MLLHILMPLYKIPVALLHCVFYEILAILFRHWYGGNDRKLVPLSLDVVVVQIATVDLHLFLSLLSVFADVHQEDVLLLVVTLVATQDAFEFA